MKIKAFLSSMIICVVVFVAGGQTVEAFEENSALGKTGLLDPSRFSINHSLSFGMSSSSDHSGLKSQSLYSTMMTYEFSKPVTLDLNFSLPIHSTYSSSNNLTPENVESLDYFKSMPFDASLNWQPTDNFSMRLSISRYTGADYFDTHSISPWYRSPLHSRKW